MNQQKNAMTDAKRILIADDHDLVRSALCSMLKEDGTFNVVGECSNAEQALEQAFVCDPDILVIDIDMPGMICFDAVGQMQKRLPELSVIFLSAFFHDHYIEQALKVGAKGYVLKGDPPSVLFKALHEVADGGAFFSKEVRARFALDPSGKPTGKGVTVTSTLTNREVEVLRYLARGLSKKEIARIMHLSVKTVEHHSSSVMRKLDIHDRVELARYAIREGLAEA
jgi:DNA-binding NarL/FixJ family response regulator